MEILLWALFGGTLPGFSQIYEEYSAYRRKQRPRPPTTGFYLTQLAAAVVSSMFVWAQYQSGLALSPFAAVELAAAAPVVVGRMIRHLPEPLPGPSAEEA